jgi:hypothetical protein
MREFVLLFRDGRVAGSGVDVVGRFTFDGEYDAGGAVRLTKQYVGKHAVEYDGRYDGEGTIAGTWTIAPVWSGRFALSPVVGDVSHLPIQEIR